MRKTSSLIGKSIVHQESGDRLASVHDIIFSDDAQHALAMLVNTGGWFREAQLIPWKHVSSIGDVVIVQGELPLVVNAVDSDVVEEWKHDVRLSGTAIITDGGERIGTVGDLFIEDDGTVVGYEVKQGFMNSSGRKFLPIEQVKVIGKDAVLAGSDELQTVTQARQEAGDLPMADKEPEETPDLLTHYEARQEAGEVQMGGQAQQESHDLSTDYQTHRGISRSVDGLSGTRGISRPVDGISGTGGGSRPTNR